MGIGIGSGIGIGRGIGTGGTGIGPGGMTTGGQGKTGGSDGDTTQHVSPHPCADLPSPHSALEADFFSFKALWHPSNLDQNSEQRNRPGMGSQHTALQLTLPSCVEQDHDAASARTRLYERPTAPS